MALKDKYLTISEVAKELKVSRQTIYRWIADNKISTEKVGDVILVKRVDLAKIKRARFVEHAEDFDEAIKLGFVQEIRERGKYSKDDEITHIGNLVFDIKKQDGTHDIADILSFSVKANEIKIKPKGKFTKKGED